MLSFEFKVYFVESCRDLSVSETWEECGGDGCIDSEATAEQNMPLYLVPCKKGGAGEDRTGHSTWCCYKD